TISVLQPANGSYFASANVAIAMQYQDDQALDLSSLSATLDGAPVNLTAGANSASGTVTAAVNSSHILTVSIKDKAGNTTSATSTFNIDTRAPDIQVLQPAAG